MCALERHASLDGAVAGGAGHCVLVATAVRRVSLQRASVIEDEAAAAECHPVELADGGVVGAKVLEVCGLAPPVDGLVVCSEVPDGREGRFAFAYEV